MELIFLDLETTGLDTDKDKILEVGAFICNDNLDVIDEFSSPVYCRSDILANMSDWCVDTHGKSGLLNLIPDAPAAWLVEERLLSWLQMNDVRHKQGKLVGYSIHFDRAVIRRQMPKLDEFLSHRMVDVSSFRDIANRWDWVPFPYQQEMPHRALEDCDVALEELRYYKKLIKPQGQEGVQRQ